jgi:hypothetical protein
MLMRVACSVSLCLGLVHCTQYALRTASDPNSNGVLRFQTPLPIAETEARLQAHLKERGKKFERRSIGPSTVFVLDWVRDSSLRYHYLSGDQRQRHFSEWAMQWNLSSRSPNQTEVSLVVLELIFIGDRRKAGPRPDAQLDHQQWFETPPDRLRAAVEARRFWVEKIGTQWPLPSTLSNINLPKLEGPPRSKDSIFYQRSLRF